MKDFLKDIIKDSLKQWIPTVLSSVVALIGSRITSGSWLKWFEFPLVWFMVAFVFCLSLIFRRYKVVKSHGKTERASGSIPPHGWEELTRIDYDNVTWVILRDGRGLDARRISPKNDPRPSEIRAKTPPVCPNCATELKETRRVWGGFKWHCINCKFKKRSKVGFCEVREDAELIARRRVEEGGGFSSNG